jgi:hypothetical protein
MPTIIDSLIVTLGLDPKDMTAKTPAAVKNLKSIEDQGSKTSKSVEGVTKSLTTLLAVIGGTVAIKAFVMDFISANAQLDRFSQNLGLSVSTISAWSNATERLGGSAQGLQGTLDMLSKAQTELRLTGESSLIPYFSALGISMADTNGQARPLDEILLSLSDRFSKMDRTTANNMGRMMGIDQGTMNVLLQGRKELELTIRRQKEQNAVTKAQAEEATKLQKSFVDAKQSFAAFGRSLLMEAAPALEKLFQLFQDFGQWIQDNREFVVDFLKVLGVGLAAVAVAAMPLNLAVLAVLALAAGIALLWQDYQTWKRGGDSLIDWEKWEPGITAAGNGIKELGKIAMATFGVIIEGARTAQAMINGNWGDKKDSKIPKWYRNDWDAGVGTIKGWLGDKGSTMGQGQPGTAEYIKKYFQDRGWKDIHAAGIAANLMSESGGKINATGDNGSAFGLAQWHSDRQAAFAKWAGHDIRSASLDEQLAFVQHELTQGSERAAGDKLRATTTASDAAGSVSTNYERPKDTAGEASRRGAYAASLMGIPGASRAATGGGGANQGAGNVDRSVETHIGEIKVYTAATDAKGIVADMGQSLDYLFASQANAGLN